MKLLGEITVVSCHIVTLGGRTILRVICAVIIVGPLFVGRSAMAIDDHHWGLADAASRSRN